MDLDGISKKLLKYVAIVISIPLSHILNLSINSGIFLNNLRTSKTVPIFKSGNHSLWENYKPISLLLSLSKVLEKKFISIHLSNHIELNELLYSHNYGLWKCKSTEHNLTLYWTIHWFKKGFWCLLTWHLGEKTEKILNHWQLHDRFQSYLKDHKHKESIVMAHILLLKHLTYQSYRGVYWAQYYLSSTWMIIQCLSSNEIYVCRKHSQCSIRLVCKLINWLCKRWNKENREVI
jgi:hypothetical protein